MEKILILGMGGHAVSVADAIERQGLYSIVGFVAKKEKSNSGVVMGYPVIGADEDLQKLYESGITNAAVGIGYLGGSGLRRTLWQKLKRIGFKLPVVCDPGAILSPHAFIGEGCFIGKGAVINVGAGVEKMCIINTKAVIEHDCFVGAFSHAAVGSVLCGNVTVGDFTLIGANATVIQNTAIGSGCIVGAGTTVKKNMEDGMMAYSTDVKYVKKLIGGGQDCLRNEGGRAA